MSTAQLVTTPSAPPEAVTFGGPPRILIVGGGFVGMYAARHLHHRLRRGEAVVTLVDPRGFMTFQPFLAEAAAGTIEPRHAVTSLRRVLPGTEVLTGRITRIDHAARRAVFQPLDGTAYLLSYDILVLAAGSVARTLPIPGLAENGIGFKSLAEAIHLRNHVLAQLDNAASVQGPQERRRALTFVVVGGGFAGVEAVAELQAMAERAGRYYPALSPRQMQWVLVEASGRILPDLDPALGQWTIRTLCRRGIQVRLGTQLVSAEGGHVVLNDGTELDAATLVWAVGGTANSLASASDLPLDEAGRVRATEFLSVHEVPGAYAAGDGAAVPDLTRPGMICAPNAQHAVRQAKTLAANIVAGLRGRPPRPYRHRYVGALGTLGRHQGVAQVYRLRLHGLLAWLTARGYHLIGVPTLNHKARVLADWALSTFFRADTIPLTDLEYPQQQVVRRRASSNPPGASGDARSPGHRPARWGEPADGQPASPAARRPAPRSPQPTTSGAGAAPS
jgi:NADH dehydrogenase